MIRNLKFENLRSQKQRIEISESANDGAVNTWLGGPVSTVALRKRIDGLLDLWSGGWFPWFDRRFVHISSNGWEVQERR